MAISTARFPSPSPHPASAAEPCASALLAHLHDYARTAVPSSDPDPEHARETQRLVAQLTTHLSAQRAPLVAVPGAAPLTRREIEVLDAVADGLSTSEIAGVLHISVNTARNHVQRILEKLGVHSRLQAVNVAARHGLLQRLAG